MMGNALGRTGMSITPVGFGSWAAGGPALMGWGSQSDDDSVAAIHRAVELGVNWIDTAAVYGFGHSETVVGRALAALPSADRPLVFTKCGLVWNDAGIESRDLDPASIHRQCDQSLSRLEIDVIDLFQIHSPDPAGPPIEDSWGAMLELVDAGKVRAVGVSNFDLGLLERCAAIGPISSLQPPLSIIRRDALDDVIPWCAEHDVGVIVYSPMASGLLTGKLTPERAAQFPDDDWRSRVDAFRSPGLERNLALADALRPIAARHGVTVAAVAVAWTTAAAGVTGAIAGARNPAQVDEWAQAGALRLGDDDLAEITAALERTGAQWAKAPATTG
jgi:aryl-alcohol dehydrogenase-like predicted oxidoreductase